jgi:hypothetical protein
MEQIPKGSYEYRKIEEEYNKLVKASITRDPNFKSFLGGLPVTLERQDVSTILSKDMAGNFRYSATQKVDGTRLLLFANFKIEEGPYKGQRNITFIDRNNEFYSLKNMSREQLPAFNGPKIIIDGELVTFDLSNKVVSPTERYSKIKMFSFMAFDIIYGPISIEYIGLPNNKKLEIGTEGSMAGPIGGKLWPYQKRYDILNRLIVPNDELNGNQPILSLAFKNCNWFIPEIKSLFFINQFNTAKKLYETDNSRAFFQETLNNTRKAFYELINTSIRIEQKNKVELIKVKLDGLIFTPWDTEYVLGGPWKKFLNIQYKWKPVDLQSIDFAIFKEGGKYRLKVRKGQELVAFTIPKPKIEGQQYNSGYIQCEVNSETYKRLSDRKTRDGTIGEFVFDNDQKKFILLDIRNDKTSPNALSTAKNVMNAIKYPVNLEIIKKFFIINRLNKEALRPLLYYMSKSQMLRCAVNNKELKLLNEQMSEKILNQIKTFKTNKGYEFEIRLGVIEPAKFQANVPFNLYRQLMDIITMMYKNVKFEYSVYYDMYKGNTRTRYLYLQDLGNITKLASIQKETIENVNLDLKFIYNIDLRFALSNEKPTSEIVNNENAELVLEKHRYSFDFGIFAVDLTQIHKYNKNPEGKEYREAPKFQIEFEIKNRTLPNDELLKKIMEVLISIVGLINS